MRQRIAATPFLVMALPAWFGVRSERRRALMAGNARWVLRLGAVIGWTDDFEDLEHDRLTAHRNRLRGMTSAQVVRQIAFEVARRAEALQDQRHAQARDSTDLDALLPLLMSSWLGGPDLPDPPADSIGRHSSSAPGAGRVQPAFGGNYER